MQFDTKTKLNLFFALTLQGCDCYHDDKKYDRHKYEHLVKYPNLFLWYSRYRRRLPLHHKVETTPALILWLVMNQFCIVESYIVVLFLSGLF